MSTCWRSRARRLRVREGPARAWPAGAAALALDWPAATRPRPLALRPRRWPRSRPTTRWACRDRARGVRRPALRPRGAAPRWSCPRWPWAAPTTGPVGSPSCADEAPEPSAPARPRRRAAAAPSARSPDAQRYTVESQISPSAWCDLVGAGHQGDGRGRVRQGRPGPPGRRDGRPAARPPGRARRGCAPPTRAATSWASTGSWPPAPSCWCRWRRHRPVAPHGRHRPPGRRPGHRPAAGGLAAGLGQGPPGAPGHHRHGPRHAAAAGAPTSTTRPSPRWWRWPTCSTWPRWWRGACRGPRPRCSSWWRRCTPRRPWPAGPASARSRWIAEHEGIDRGRYAGTCGWVDARRQRHLGGLGALRRDRRRPRPGVRRQRHRGRQRPADRAGRDPGQAPALLSALVRP